MLIKDINFFDRYKEAERLEKNVSKATMVRTFVVVGIVVVTFVTTSFLQVLKLERESEINRINTYISSEEVVKQLADIEAKKLQLDGATKYYEGIVMANNDIKTYVKPDKQLIDSLLNLLPTGTVVEELKYSNGTFNLELLASDEDQLAEYINKLGSHKRIYGLGYAGFSQASDLQYISNVSIGITPGGGEDE